MFKKLLQKTIYTNPWLTFFEDEIEFPDGSKGIYSWANRKNGVAIVVVTRDKQILLHHEYRYVVKEYSWEIQGGGIDQGETPEQAAVRELQEEAGLTVSPTVLKKLGVFYPMSSFNTEHITLFMVVTDQTTINTTHLEAGEAIESHKFVSFEAALAMIDSGEISDVLTANAIQMAVRQMETITQ